MAEKIHFYHLSLKKFFFDFGLGLMVLGVIWPVLIAISVVIFLNSSWPVFFVQKRMGKGKQAFKMYKFRTMYVGAQKDQKKFSKFNKAPGPMFKIFDDPRFVGIGRWLARTGLDELPQIFNIIKGEMSFVGPRPLPVKEAKALSSSWDFRHLVKPGVFSQWTLAENRHRSLTDWKNLDRKTVASGSMSEDLELVVKTLRKVFAKD